MPVRINNLESDVRVMEGEPSKRLSENEIERIVRIVMERIREEQYRMERISEETRITNKVSKQDLFD